MAYPVYHSIEVDIITACVQATPLLGVYSKAPKDTCENVPLPPVLVVTNKLKTNHNHAKLRHVLNMEQVSSEPHITEPHITHR